MNISISGNNEIHHSVIGANNVVINSDSDIDWEPVSYTHLCCLVSGLMRRRLEVLMRQN